MADIKRLTITGGGGGGGYDTIAKNSAPLPQESTLNFIGASVNIADSPGTTSTNVSFATNLNDIAALTPTAGNVLVGNGTHYVNGNAYQTVLNSTAAVTQRTKLNITGTGLTATDNAGTTSTDLALSNNLQDLSALTPNANSVISGNGTDFVDTIIATGNILYVSTTAGNDTTGNGSVIFPYATIDKAVTVASTNDAIFIYPGTYTESVSFAGKTQITLQAVGGTDYGSVFIDGTQSFTSTSNHITFIGISFNNSSAAMATINAAAHIVFQNCVFNAGSATNPAITVTGAIFGECVIRDCLITGTVSNAATAFFQLYIIGQQSTACNVTVSNGATLILNCPNLGKVTHSGGIIELNNIASVQATAGNSITSTAAAAATNQFFMFNTNLQQSDLSYGTLVKSGACIYVIANSNYNPTTSLTGTRQNFGTLASDVNANYTPTNYTATNSSVTGNLTGIDNALGALPYSSAVVITTNTTLVMNTTYIVNGAGLLTLTLPATFTAGQFIKIVGYAGGWTIAQNGGQNILYNGTGTTIGVGGSLSSTLDTDSVSLYAVVNNTNLVASDIQGNLNGV